MKKRGIVRALAGTLAVLMPLTTAYHVFAEEAPEAAPVAGVLSYDSPDINELTGHGLEPEELSVSAAAQYMEKAWYEYVTYSEKPIASYRINDNARYLFYDPYTYTNSMVMEVKKDAAATEYDTMSSYTVSHTTSKTIESAVESTSTYTKAEQESERDQNGASTDTDSKSNEGSKAIHTNTVETSGKEIKTDKYNYEQRKYTTSSESVTAQEACATKFAAKTSLNPLEMFSADLEETVTIGATENVTFTQHNDNVLQSVDHETKYDDFVKTTTDTTEYHLDTTDHAETTGWTQLGKRTTQTFGSARSQRTSWSETEGTTITKVYEATHFTSDGVTPLPWAVVHYEVKMPMKCDYQIKYSGEWVTVSSIYTLLTTIQGTCRTWIENGQAYYEDWGSGEPVVETDFWGQFMTIDQLKASFTNKLYPVGGGN